MRLLPIFLSGFITLAAFVPTYAAKKDTYPTLKTSDGEEYHKVTVMKVTASSLRILHKDGIASVPLSQLSDKLKAKYGFDEKAAKEHEKEKSEKRAAALKNRAEHEKRMRIVAEEMKIAAEEKKKQKELEASARFRDFMVLQVTKSGLLVNNVETSVIATGSARFGGGGGSVRSSTYRGSSVYFIEGFSSEEDIVDGDIIKGKFYEKGIYSYTDIRGAQRTVKKFIYIKGAKD